MSGGSIGDMEKYIKECNCRSKFSVEPHGDAHVMYFSRCGHQHGQNLFTITDIAFNADINSMLKKLNRND